jgi:hypothetical protein
MTAAEISKKKIRENKMIRTIAFGDRLIEAYVYKNVYSFFDAVYVEDDTMYHLSLEDPTNPECDVARRLKVGINFDYGVAPPCDVQGATLRRDEEREVL